MAGKLNLPPDSDKRKNVKGAAIGGPGLNAVDEERAASMADEGGASGSTVETQEDKRTADRPNSRPRRRGRR
jgi:hypothetical protein